MKKPLTIQPEASVPVRVDSKDPDLSFETILMQEWGGPVIGMDEVGRGSLAGPVLVGAVMVDASTHPLHGVRDSKLLSEKKRLGLLEQLSLSSLWSTGQASAEEIDEVGIIRALRLAGLRAIASLPGSLEPAGVLLDGSFNWLSASLEEGQDALQLPVRTRVKADMTCWSVAAASIFAKVTRDRLMTEASSLYPAYGFESHKGYGTAAHRRAIMESGPCDLHRRSWALTGSKSTVNLREKLRSGQ